MEYRQSLCGAVLLLISLVSCNEQTSVPLSPEEALGSFVLAEEALEIELVAAEPLVQDPVAMSFDKHNRIWVVEMLGFMPDIDGKGEDRPVGRVSILHDEDQDGQMDRSQIFLDSLVLPRAIAVVKGGALIAERIKLWYAQDRTNDDRADKKTLIDPYYGGQGMPEHSANGLWRGIDNWYYNAKSSVRYRQEGNGWLLDSTEFRGQWGICHDNGGRLFYNYNWSQLHADLVPPNTLNRNQYHPSTSGIDHPLTLDRKIYPIRSNFAVNRGYVPGTLDAEGKLLEFASVCAPFVYRGQALGSEWLQHAFVCEPTANLIKVNEIVEDGFMLSADPVYRDREFLASSDERFRPIYLAGGPDGALYIVDMYRGIIQHGPYMTDYLRQVTLDRSLDKPIHLGRIWRITSKKSTKPSHTPLGEMNKGELISALDHGNGWIRDRAQQLLVEDQDTSLINDLKKTFWAFDSLGQLHALWTMSGLGISDHSFLLKAANIPSPLVQQTSLRILASQLRTTGDQFRGFIDYARKNFASVHAKVQLQLILDADILPAPVAFSCIDLFLENYGHLSVARDAVINALINREWSFLQTWLAKPDQQKENQPTQIFVESLTAAIGRKGYQRDILDILKIIDSLPPADWRRQALINGITNAGVTIALKRRPEMLEELEDSITRKELEAVLDWPGKPKRMDKKSTEMTSISPKELSVGRQKYLSLCASCHGIKGQGMKRFAPPLKNAEWVTGDVNKLVMILLHGLEGPIVVNGQLYDSPEILPIMPSFSNLQNRDLADIINYIRNSWGHIHEPIDGQRVGHIRYRTQGKIKPWTASELDTFNFDFEL